MFQSEYPGVELPPQDVASFAFSRAQTTVFGRDKSTPVIIDGHTRESISFAELQAWSKGFAAGLIHNLGIARDDLVLMLADNDIYIMPCFYGILMAGACIAPLDPNITVNQVVSRLKYCRPKAILTCARTYSKALDAVLQVDIGIPRKNVILVRSDPSFPGVLDSKSVCSDRPFEPFRISTVREASSTMAALVHSSGSTTDPKGIIIHHSGFIACVLQELFMDSAYQSMIPKVKIEGPGHVLTCLVQYPLYGLSVTCLTYLARGLTVVMTRPTDLSLILSLVEDMSIHLIRSSPALLHLISCNWDIVSKFNTSSLSRYISAGSMVDPDLKREFEARLGVPIHNDYGCSETFSISFPIPFHNKHRRAVGKLRPGLRAKVTDQDGRELGPGEVGKIHIWTPGRFLGYFNKPEDTAKTIGPDGYICVEDMGYISEDGFLTIYDRWVDTIINEGHYVFPTPLEQLLIKHPRVSDCAIIGINDPPAQAVKAYVVLALDGDNGDATKSDHAPQDVQRVLHEIKDWFDNHDTVKPYERLSGGIESIDNIPRGPGYKSQRFKLRALHQPQGQAAVCKNT